MKSSALALTFLALLAPAALAAVTNDGGKARSFAHDLEPGDIAEECLHLGAGKSRRFEWTADKPVDFNIHFHQGDKVTYPVQLNGQRKGGGKFTATVGEDYCWMWTAKGRAKVTGRLDPEE